MASSRRLGRLACAALLTCFVTAQSGWAAPYDVAFHSGTVSPEAGRFDLPAASPLDASAGRVHVLLQLEEHLLPGQQDALAAQGVELLAYLPDRAYVASIESNVKASRLAGLGVRHVSPFLPGYKLHPRVTSGDFGTWSEYTGQRRIFAVEVMPDVPLSQAQIALENAGCEAGNRFEAAHTLLAAVQPDRIGEIAQLDAVMFIDEAPPPFDMVNDVVRTRLHVNEVQDAPYGLSGSGVTLFVYDGGMVDGSHPDFGTRVTWNETAATDNHPTHVAGTAGGDGRQSGGQYRGMAPQVRIISGQYDACIPYCLYESPNDIEEDYTSARATYGVEIVTNSIGANIDPNNYPQEWFGDYETTSRLLDRLVRNTGDSPLIVVFAAGNERNGDNHGFTSYRCMSVPSGAKNIITVGATTGTDGVATFSSWGPTDDGRLKPEVCATGVNVHSCILGGGYGDMSGTSMATPATSGTACLILEQWHRLFPGAADPLPETMKAILINSTTDIGPAGPDFQTGFGLVNALQAVQNVLAGGVLESALEVGEHVTHDFTVASGLSALDVSLAWSDVPAAGNVIPTLVNDLDLYLEDPNGAIHQPWVMRHNNPGAPPTIGRDSVNVCERVHVTSPIAGEWTLHVTGAVNSGPSQTFGVSANVPLVASWGTVTGIVRDSSTSEGLAARVSVVGGSQYALTDTATGSYLLSVPGDSHYVVQAISYGYAPRSAAVTVSGGTASCHLALVVAQNGTLSGRVTNQTGTPLANATVSFSFFRAQIPSVTTSASGGYSAQLPGANTYDVMADFEGQQGFGTVFVPENGTATLDIVIVDPRFQPAGPDGYGYMAYEASDPLMPALYDWLEISPVAGGPGTAIHGTPGNDWHVAVDLPFPVTFYGTSHTQIRVSADGWIALGGTMTGDSLYRNVSIPDPDAPNGVIYLFWDDLYPYDASEGGDMAYYFDQANGRFIVEYHAVPHFTPRTNQTTAQLIFYDAAVRPTRTGDNEFQLQYQSVDYEDSSQDDDATVGIENYDGSDGLQIVYNGAYNAACFELGPQYALRFTTGPVPGYGSVHGHVAGVPQIPNLQQVSVGLGSYSTHPDANGDFELDSVVAGRYTLTVTYAGYEQGRVENVQVEEDDTLTFNFSLYRLDPPRNLSGEYEQPVNEIHLTWEWPVWHDMNGAPHDPGSRSLDEFVGFEVFLDCRGVVDTVADTSYTYHVTWTGEHRFWITALYDGGRSDTSNHWSTFGTSSAGDPGDAVPSEYYLRPNYPNPFNPETRIEYGLPRASQVALEVFDVLGRRVAVLFDSHQSAGVHAARFNGSGLGSGVYYCRLQAGSFSRVQKMLLMR